jgi:glyoxylase-like metal-dependent hydrolase (beta-lactamase superfamily II)
MINVKIFSFNPLSENTYLLYTEDKNSVIIDPGCYFDHEKEELIHFVQKNGLKPTLLVNTHCHLDHVFGNKFIYEEFGLELHLHPLEKDVLDRAPASGLLWNVPFDNYSGPLHWIGEENPLTWGKEVLHVLHTPGHSPGSVCLYSKENAFVIGGDVLFRESVGRTDLPGGNPNQLIQSIEEKLYTLPDETVVYPGHGIPTKIGYEKANNPFVKGS